MKWRLSLGCRDLGFGLVAEKDAKLTSKISLSERRVRGSGRETRCGDLGFVYYRIE